MDEKTKRNLLGYVYCERCKKRLKRWSKKNYILTNDDKGELVVCDTCFNIVRVTNSLKFDKEKGCRL